MPLGSPELLAEITAQLNKLLEQGKVQQISPRAIPLPRIEPLSPAIRICGAFPQRRNWYQFKVKELGNYVNSTSRSL